MSKKTLLIPAFIIIVFCFLFSPKLAFANPEQEVLGDYSNLSIPPTSEGPGLILPDSPLFFLDQIKQTVRLALAFSPEEKAKVYASVAGERLAELRIMLVKKNEDGIQIALNGVSSNFAKAAESVGDAQLSGRDVSKLAENINTDIKAKQETLDELESQAGVVLKPRLAVVTQALLGAKVKIELSLPKDQILGAVTDDVNRLATKNLNSISVLTRNLDKQFSQLERQASDSSKTFLGRREEALKKAIESKNEALIKVQQKMFEEDKKRLQVLLELQQKAAQEVKEASQRLQVATQRYQKLQDLINQFKNTGTIPSTVSATPTPTTTPTASTKTKVQ